MFDSLDDETKSFVNNSFSTIRKFIEKQSNISISANPSKGIPIREIEEFVEEVDYEGLNFSVYSDLGREPALIFGKASSID